METLRVFAGILRGSIFGPTHFLLYTMTFQMMLSVILLFMLMILLPIVSVTRYLICSNY